MYIHAIIKVIEALNQWKRHAVHSISKMVETTEEDPWIAGTYCQQAIGRGHCSADSRVIYLRRNRTINLLYFEQ